MSISKSMLIGLIGLLSLTACSVKVDNSTNLTNFTSSELSAFDGKNGNKCYVAVDGSVYEISGTPFWMDGEHIKSDGQAFCGNDLSNVIDQAPHGRSVLTSSFLTKVGSLQ